MQENDNLDAATKLKALVEQINQGHLYSVRALRASVECARETGNCLIEAKGIVESQGKKLIPWVQKNCKFSSSEAQRYMRIADRHSELLEKCKDPRKLTMTEALKFLPPKKKVDGCARHPSDRRFVVGCEGEATRLAAPRRAAIALRASVRNTHASQCCQSAAVVWPRPLCGVPHLIDAAGDVPQRGDAT